MNSLIEQIYASADSLDPQARAAARRALLQIAAESHVASADHIAAMTLASQLAEPNPSTEGNQ